MRHSVKQNRKIGCTYKAWVTLGKVWCEFGHFGVKICHQRTLPNVTLTFPVHKNFENWEKLQRCHNTWVGQAEKNFGLTIAITAVTITACQWTANRKYEIKLTVSKICFVHALSLPWMDVDFIITIHHSSPFISVPMQSIHNMCTLKAKVVVLKRQLL